MKISIKNAQLNRIRFLFNDTTLASNNPLRIRKNLFNTYDKDHDN